MSNGRPLIRLALATGLVAVAVGCQGGPSAAPAPATPAAMAGADRTLVYVANQDAASVTVVDGETHEVVATVDLAAMGYGANAKPHHVVAEPDGTHWYVSLIGANRVLKLDRGNEVVAEAELEVPGMLALDPLAGRLYVGRSMSAVNPPRRVAILDRRTMAGDELDVFFPRPHAVAAHPTLQMVYSASLAENSMAVIRPHEEDVDVRSIHPPARGHDVHTLVQWAISPSGRAMVGTGEMSGRLLVYDLADPTEPELVMQVPVSPRPWHPVFSPDGGEVWFANKGSNTVTVVEAREWSVTDVITGEGLAQPHGAAISPDGRYVFVSNNNVRSEEPDATGTLVVIDRSARAIVTVVPVGANAAGIAVAGPARAGTGGD